MTSELLAAAGGLLDEAVDLRRRIHRRPELGLDLPVTQEVVVDALDGLPLTLHTGTATTSVVAVLEGEGDGPTVLLRADMDALPMPEDTGLAFASTVDGAMHACGHDAHVAMLVGAARLLADRRGDLPGRVLFMFQPGEEGWSGARVMLDEGLLAVAGPRPSAAFAIHQTPTVPAGAVTVRAGAFLASANAVTITVTGRGGHASMPHHALDPVPVACEIVLALQSLVTRRVDVFDPGVVTIARIRAGSTDNVIPETAQLLGTIRAVSERTRTDLFDGVRRVAAGVAAAHGAEVEVTVHDGYPVTVNDATMAALAAEVAADVLGPSLALPMANPVMGAEDFSYVLQEVPGTMVFLGTNPDGRGPAAPNHSNRMVLDEAAMANGIALYAAMALRCASS
jgi:amidohydrolase